MEKRNIYDKEMTLLHNRVSDFCQKGRYKSALDTANELIALFEQKGLANTREYAEELFTIGYVCDVLADYVPALDYYKKAKDILEIADAQSLLLADVLNNSAIILAKHGRFDGAIRYFTMARLVVNKNMNKKYAAALTYSIGSCYIMKKDYARAALYYTESMKTFQLKGLELVDTFCNLGYCLEVLSTPAQAIGCFENALVLFNAPKHEEKREFFAIKLRIARLYVETDNIQKALSMLNSLTEEIADEFGTQNMQYVYSVNMLSNIYTQIDGKMAAKYKKSAIGAMERITSKEHFMYKKMVRELAEIYRNSGDFTNALEAISQCTLTAQQSGNTDTDEYVNSAIIQADILRKQDKATEAISLLESIVYGCSNKREGYVQCILMLVHLYLQYGYGKALYGIYDKFVQVRPGNSFDDMLDMSEEY